MVCAARQGANHKICQAHDGSRCVYNERSVLDAQLTVVVEAPRLNTPLRTHSKAGVLACLHISDAARQGDLKIRALKVHIPGNRSTASTVALAFRTSLRNVRGFLRVGECAISTAFTRHILYCLATTEQSALKNTIAMSQMVL